MRSFSNRWVLRGLPFACVGALLGCAGSTDSPGDISGANAAPGVVLPVTPSQAAPSPASPTEPGQPSAGAPAPGAPIAVAPPAPVPGAPVAPVTPGAPPVTPSVPNPVVALPPGSQWSATGPRVVRLSHFQWENSVRSLLRLERLPELDVELTPDGVTAFDTNANQLQVSGTLREDYERAAEQLAAAIVQDAAAVERLAPDAGGQEARARTFVESFGLRAYRRPLSNDEVNRHLELFARGPELAPDLEPFDAGLMLTLRLFLQSPLFLYRTELGVEATDGRIVLGPYEVAAKVALATTGTLPDEALLDAAANGTIGAGADSAVLEQHVERLLNSPEGKASAQHFHRQHYALSRYNQIDKDRELHPEFSEGTPADMRTSVELFLDNVYETGGLTELLSSPTQFVNASLAPIYGLDGAFGDEFTQVDLSANARAGLLTNVGLLSVYAGDVQPDAIHRGVFVAENILCLALPTPVANVPPLPPPEENQTNRELVDSITGPGTCGEGCHSVWINPLGFAFEGYDALGRVRATDAGQAVNTAGQLPLDGETRQFANALELAATLASSPQAHDCYAKRWLSYLQGRELEAADDLYLKHLNTGQDQLPVKQLIAKIVTDPSFITRNVEGAAQ